MRWKYCKNMEYMKRQAALYETMVGKYTRVIPYGSYKDAIEFYDDHGMFRIRHRDTDNRDPKELIRYDQVASYERYLEESEPDEPGKPKVFGECGVDITLVGGDTEIEPGKKGLRAHPYITETIRVCVNNRDKKGGELEVNQIINHFNAIFGVNDDTKGLFDFGPTKQQRREGAALAAMGGVLAAAVQAAKTGEVSEETKTQVTEAMNQVEDAATMGLAKYSRLADEAEAQIQ